MYGKFFLLMHAISWTIVHSCWCMWDLNCCYTKFLLSKILGWYRFCYCLCVIQTMLFGEIIQILCCHSPLLTEWNCSINSCMYFNIFTLAIEYCPVPNGMQNSCFWFCGIFSLAIQIFINVYYSWFKCLHWGNNVLSSFVKFRHRKPVPIKVFPFCCDW